MKIPRIIFTTPVLEHPAAGGPQLRIENSIKALNKISELHIISRVSPGGIGSQDDIAYIKNICNLLNYSPSANEKKTLFKKILNKLLPNNPKRKLKKDVNYIYKYALKINADIIWFGYGNISFPLIKELRILLPKTVFVCDTDSVWSRFILRELDVEENPSRRQEIEKEGKAKELEEKDNSSICDITTAVSEIDAIYYRGIAPDANRIHIFSNVIDLDTYVSPPLPPSDFKSPSIFIGGSYYSSNSPMVHAANWVIKEIMPFVWKKYPTAHVYIVGRGGEEFCSELTCDNVTITGKVPSVLPYLCNSICSLVPLSFESGTRYKILESGACGIPVVSTTLGAEGIPVKNGNDCLIADSADDFANAIIKLLDDSELRKQLGNNCKELIKKHYSIDSLVQEANAVFSYLNKCRNK